MNSGGSAGYAHLPHHHRDPFDRRPIAQALEENLTIVSIDRSFDAYGIERVW
jgi:PIN domain nuclease of toxin-antitoxin system